MASLIIDLGCAVKPLGVSFCYHKIFPSLLQVALVDSFYLCTFGSESVLGSHVAGIDRAGRTHDPVGDSCEIFNKVELSPELFVGGSGWVDECIRGIDRNRGVIIFLY